MSDEQLLTPAQTAERLVVSRGTVYRYLSTGVLRGVKLGAAPSSPVRISSEELKRFTKARTIGGDLHACAEKILTLQGIDPAAATAAEYREALEAAGDYADATFVDQVAAGDRGGHRGRGRTRLHSHGRRRPIRRRPG